ncbi:MAG: YeeE/YedE thiosulfate transporter family protein [Chthoniobacteraceae bacterium]
MEDIDRRTERVSDPQGQPSSGGKLALAAVFGLTFGFLLQKGGVAKFNVLIGQLLLEDWTVVKVMCTAILVGMIGVSVLHGLGRVSLHLQPTRFGANIIGGLIFGVGFALLAYCPGTGAAALGQGNWDALFGIVGLMAGSYLYAELSEWLERTVRTWGDRGVFTLPDLLRLSRRTVVMGMAVILCAVLVVLEKLTIR